MDRIQTFKKLGTLPCTACKAQCCRYVAVELDKPSSKSDYDMVRWYLLHDKVSVYEDHDGDWYVEFETKCDALQEDERCGFYEERPQVCRDHGWPVGSCEYFGVPHKHLFNTVREYEAFLDKKGIDWRWKRRPKTART